MRRLAAGLLALSIHAPTAEATTLDEQLRALHVAQNRIVRGDPEAQALAKTALAEIERGFAAMDEKAFADAKSLRAATLFLLSGGSPRPLARFAAAASGPTDDLALFKASLTQAQGRKQAARAAFLALDAKSLPASLRAHVALTRGILLAASDAEKAREAYDTARLLLPGSLVEEAALRRETPLLAGKTQLLAQGARRYAALYAQSPYSAYFWSAVKSAALGAGALEPGMGEAIIVALDPAPPALRTEICVELLRAQIRAGNMREAQHLLDVALTGRRADERERFEFYRNLVSTLETGAPPLSLKQTAPGADDAHFLNGLGEALAKAERLPPKSAAAGAEPPRETIAAIEKALADVDALLASTQR